MSSRMPPQPMHRPPSRPSSFHPDSRISQIKSRISQIAHTMRNPLNPSNTLPIPQHKKTSATLGSFLTTNGFSDYLQIFQNNQITLTDLPFLTKADLVDMKIPIGPRNRLLSLFKTLEETENSEKTQERSQSSLSGKCVLKDEVDKFIGELGQVSKRSEKAPKCSSRDPSLDNSFESGGVVDSILGVLREIGEKQKIMAQAIEENRRAIVWLKQQSNAKCNY